MLSLAKDPVGAGAASEVRRRKIENYLLSKHHPSPDALSRIDWNLPRTAPPSFLRSSHFRNAILVESAA